jgi:signal transduction histidine kinase
MIQSLSDFQVESVDASSLVNQLRDVSVFAGADMAGLGTLGNLELLRMAAGESVVQAGDKRGFYVLLEGAVKIQPEAKKIVPLVYHQGDTFGEIAILANKKWAYTCTATEPALLVRFDEDKFWKLMFACPSVRAQVLGNMAMRLESYQAQEMHREKLTSLGTMAAGLMHELKNPGTAAIRAASQMRENLGRVQKLSLKLSRTRPSSEQIECLSHLQELALGAVCSRAMGSLEQADAEQEMEEKLEAAGVENGWRLAPTLVSMGMTSEELECAKAVFSGEELSDSLNWLESLMSSMQLVGTIEESLGRVHDLIMAVKHYSYEDEASQQTIDVHKSLHSTMVILGHKLRQKQITLEKDFAANLPQIHLRAGGLNQVWTNLLDNAIDASPEGGVIKLRTSQEGEFIQVSIEDHGPGISPENAARVFEPFFTTKPVGIGSGLGLDIVHRILSMKLGGTVKFDSAPGRTVFTVRLPMDWNAEPAS